MPSGLGEGEAAAVQAGLGPSNKGGAGGARTAGDEGAPWAGGGGEGPGRSREPHEDGGGGRVQQAASGVGDLDAFLPEWLREAESVDDVLKVGQFRLASISTIEMVGRAITKV